MTPQITDLRSVKYASLIQVSKFRDVVSRLSDVDKILNNTVLEDLVFLNGRHFVFILIKAIRSTADVLLAELSGGDIVVEDKAHKVKADRRT